jgi:hypothetical protein
MGCNWPLRLQKKIAKAIATIGNTTPNSSRNHGVLPELWVKGVNIDCAYRLWLAYKRAAVHRLPDFNRIQAKINEMARTMTVKQISPYQAGVPAL